MKRNQRVFSAMALAISVTGLYYYGNGNLLNPDYCETETCTQRSFVSVTAIFVLTLLILLRLFKKVHDYWVLRSPQETYTECECGTYECWGDCWKRYEDLMDSDDE